MLIYCIKQVFIHSIKYIMFFSGSRASGHTNPPSLVWSWSHRPSAMVVSPRSCEYFDLHSCRICSLLTFWAFGIFTLIDLCLSLALCVYIIYLFFLTALPNLIDPPYLISCILSHLTLLSLSFLTCLSCYWILTYLSYLTFYLPTCLSTIHLLSI